MLIADLFAQNVRGFPAQMRASLSAGANELSPTPPDFLILVRTLFYSKSFDPNANFAAVAPARAGVMFTHQGETYRLLRDLSTGAAQLAMKNAQGLATIAEGASEVCARLRSDFSVPGEEIFDTLLVLSSTDFPSQADKPSGAGRPRAQIEQEIKTLRAQSGSGSKALEYELDGLQKQRFAWEDLQGQRQRLVDEANRARARLQGGEALDGLPENFAGLVADFHQAKSKRETELAAIAEPEDALPPAQPAPLGKQAPFWAAILSGLVLLVLCFVLPGQWRFVGLLDVAAFGWAAIVAWLWVTDAEAFVDASTRGRRHAELRLRIEERFTAKTALVKQTMATLRLEANEIVEMMQQRAPLRAQLAEHEQGIAAFDAGPGKELFSHEHDRVAARISEIEDQLSLSVQTTAADGQLMLQRITALERELATPATRAPFSLLPLLRAVSELNGKSLEQNASALGARAAQFLDQWWGKPSALILGEDGAIEAMGVSWSAHAANAKDQIFLALRLAAFESTAPPLPLWIDGLEVLPHILPAWLKTYLPFIAQKAQVVASGSRAAFGLPVQVVIA